LAAHAGTDFLSGNEPRRELILVGITLGLLSGCSEPPDPRRTNFEIRGKDAVVKYDPKTGRLRRIDADTNKNGRIDAFSYWDATRLIRVEIDRDEDGKIDRWEHYDESRKLIRVGSSSKDDEVEDTWAYPDANGFLAKVETDTDRNGDIDKRETYIQSPSVTAGRVLTVVELGLDAAGNPARRLYYRPDGSFDRSETLRP
jgi:hypothetical protein